MIRQIAGNTVFLVRRTDIITCSQNIRPAVGNRHGTACGLKHGQIVETVAERDKILWRKPKNIRCFPKRDTLCGRKRIKLKKVWL